VYTTGFQNMHKRKTYNIADEVPLEKLDDPKPGFAEVRQTDKVELKRSVTLINGIGIIVGSIIGSGIFLTPSNVYVSAQDPYWALGVWAGCGLFSLVGAICFAELGTCITRSGGDYAYIYEAFGPFAAFLTLWVTVIAIRPTTVAIVAMTFAKYAIKPFFLTCDGPANAELLLAAACVCLLTAVNCLSVKWTMKIQDIFTAAKLIALACIILTGFIYLLIWSLSDDPNAKYNLERNTFASNKDFSDSKSFEQPFSWTGLSNSFYGGLFAYAGWNYLNLITQELKDPYTNLPRAIYIGLPLVTIIYVLANAAYFIVLSPSEIAGNNAVAASFGALTYSVYMQWMIPVFVAMSTFGGVNGTLFTTARMFFAGAEVGQMPEILACVHIKRFTPVPALLFSGGVSLIVMFLGDIGTLLNYVSFILWVSTGLSVAAMIWLRRTQPDLERPIRVSLVWPWIYVIFTTILVGGSAFSTPLEILYGILITLTGVPVYLIFIWWPERTTRLKKKSPEPSPCCVSMTSFLQKIFSVIPQEKIIKYHGVVSILHVTEFFEAVSLNLLKMIREILVFLCILGMTLGASVGTSTEVNSSRDLPIEDPVTEALPEELVGAPEVVPQITGTLAANIPEPPRAPLPPPIPVPLPPIRIIHNGTVSSPIPSLWLDRPPVLAFNHPGVFMERYFWPLSASPRAPAPTLAKVTPKLRSHVPYHLDSVGQSYLNPALSYPSMGFQGAGYPPVNPQYYSSPYDNYGYYYYTFDEFEGQ
ncbi:unnamed protein product, partial [Allacma fusca]